MSCDSPKIMDDPRQQHIGRMDGDGPAIISSEIDIASLSRLSFRRETLKVLLSSRAECGHKLLQNHPQPSGMACIAAASHHRGEDCEVADHREQWDAHHGPGDDGHHQDEMSENSFSLFFNHFFHDHIYQATQFWRSFGWRNCVFRLDKLYFRLDKLYFRLDKLYFELDKGHSALPNLGRLFGKQNSLLISILQLLKQILNMASNVPF